MVKWKEWGSVAEEQGEGRRSALISNSAPLGALVAKIRAELPRFITHHHLAKHQHMQFTQHIALAQQSAGMLVLSCDYAEKFSVLFDNEVI